MFSFACLCIAYTLLLIWLLPLGFPHALSPTLPEHYDAITNRSRLKSSIKPRAHIVSHPGCSWYQRGTIIRGLYEVSQWSQWAINTAIGRHIDALDYKRAEVLQHYFGGDSQLVRNSVQHRFASLQYEVDRSPEGRFQQHRGRVLFSCDNAMRVCRQEHLSEIFPRLNMVVLVCPFFCLTWCTLSLTHSLSVSAFL